MRLSLMAAVTAVLVLISAAARAEEAAATKESTMGLKSKSPNVYVRVIGADGKLSKPVVMPRVIHTDAEWKRLLTDEQYRIMRTQGTEAAFCGGLLKNHEAGVYVCAACGLPLFASGAKFES